MKQILYLCALTLLFTFLGGCDSNSETNSGHSATPSPANNNAFPPAEAEKLLQRLATQDGCKDSTADLRLSFTDAEGKPQQMDFRLQRKYEPGKVSTLMTVLAPPEESEKALSAIQEDGKPTSAISYLAGLKKVTQLKSDNPLNFRGSKSTVQEMLGMELGEYEIVAATVANGVLLMELKAQNGLSLPFPRIDVTFAESDRKPVKFELYDARKEKVKTIQATEVKAVQNYQTITKMDIEDHRNNLKLKLETRNIKYDTNLPASLFTEANLIKNVTAASQKQIQ
ncbi:MAG TPA: outer membrane lipoprotein-sorting protein [Blastocatellia bacterium]|nr:outer membrane lipoprotein-sorting protein [Blastocatellia bacterium]